MSSPLPDELLDGFRRFRSTRYQQERARYQQLMERGQRPATMLIGCSDSRSGPEVVFDALPGELFIGCRRLCHGMAALLEAARERPAPSA